MSSEILAVLEYMEKEKGISREDMIVAITQAIKSSALKGVNAGHELRIEVNPRNGDLRSWAQLTVVDSVSDPKNEVHIEKARQENPDIQLGDIVEREVQISDLGRIAAQSTRQAIMQRVRQFEKERIYDDYKDSVDDIVSGIVRRRERSDLVIDLGKAEAMLRGRDRVPGEDYAPGERIRCLLLDIEPTNRGPELVLSRSSIKFVRRLFELEVTEIADGTVTIDAIAREPGYRTKIAVSSNDSKVDPVGACVGARGARVKSIVRELNGEKIDIVRYHSDPVQMLEEAIKPAVPKNIRMDEEAKRIYFEVDEEELSIAIGRRGQNAKLTSRLLGWRLDIAKTKDESMDFDDRVAAAIEGWHDVPGIADETARKLVDMGIINPEAFVGVEQRDLIDAGITEEEAASVIELVNTHRQQRLAEPGEAEPGTAPAEEPPQQA